MIALYWENAMSNGYAPASLVQEVLDVSNLLGLQENKKQKNSASRDQVHTLNDRRRPTILIYVDPLRNLSFSTSCIGARSRLWGPVKRLDGCILC